MAIEYTVKVNEMRVAPEGELPDVVKEVGYTITGKDGSCEFSLPNIIQLPNPDQAEFVPFSELTENEVIAWIEASDLSSVKAHIAYVVAKEVEKAALEQKPLPWAPAPEAPAAPADVAA